MLDRVRLQAYSTLICIAMVGVTGDGRYGRPKRCEGRSRKRRARYFDASQVDEVWA